VTVFLVERNLIRTITKMFSVHYVVVFCFVRCSSLAFLFEGFVLTSLAKRFFYDVLLGISIAQSMQETGP
jgi:hypothetical protein